MVRPNLLYGSVLFKNKQKAKEKKTRVKGSQKVKKKEEKRKGRKKVRCQPFRITAGKQTNKQKTTCLHRHHSIRAGMDHRVLSMLVVCDGCANVCKNAHKHSWVCTSIGCMNKCVRE